ncbi:MAG: ribosome maturation factor RimM [Polyangiaceae bacterium]
MIEPKAWVPLAEIARSHGVKGELRLKLYNSDSDLLLDADEILLRLPDGEEQEVSVDGARRANDAILMRLHAINDRDKADELRTAKICLRRSEFPKLEDGEFYFCDAIGCKAYFGETLLGEVKEILSYPSVSVVVLHSFDGGGDWEVPLTDAFISSVDVEAGRVEIATMEGLERLGVGKSKSKKL